MTRVAKIMLAIPTTIVCVDILLMIINGTIMMVLGTLCGFYLIASLAFKESAFCTILHWINTGQLALKNRDDLSRH